MYSRYGIPPISLMRPPSATPKTTRYRSEVRRGGIRVCTQTLVKRRISRERSVRNGLSTSITSDHLQIHLFDALRPVPPLELLAGPLGGDPATVYERDLLAESLRLLQVVRGEQDGEPVAIQLPDVAPQLVAQLHVHPGSRLVEKQYLRVVHERPGEQNPPLHPAGESIDPLFALLREGEAFEQLLGSLPGLLFRHAVVAGVEKHGLLDGQELVEVYLLGGDPDHAPRLPKLPVSVAPEHLDDTRVRACQAHDAVYERRLPRPVRSQEPEEPPRLDLQRDPVQGQEPGRVRFLQLLDLERRDPIHPGTSEPRSLKTFVRPAPTVVILIRQRVYSQEARAAKRAITPLQGVSGELAHRTPDPLLRSRIFCSKFFDGGCVSQSCRHSDRLFKQRAGERRFTKPFAT